MTTLADRLSLWLLGAMACLPFLVPVHAAPISTFYPEWIACALGLAAVPAILSRRGNVQWPTIGYLPLWLTGILLVQTVTGLLPYAETGLLAMLYLLWAALVMTIAATLKQRVGLEVVATHLAAWLLLGAILGAGAGLLGLAGISSPWLMPIDGRHAIYGNLAQQNQFAHHVWLGIASALYLTRVRRLRLPVLVAALAVLLPAAALSGSRAGLLYAGWIVIAGHFWSGLGGNRSRLAVALAYLACVALLPHWLGWGDASPAARTISELTAGGNIRPMLLRVGWQMFLDSPWLGSGFGSFSRESFDLAVRVPEWRGVGEHAHNLVAQLLGELGLFAALGTAVAFFVWGRGVARARSGPGSGWLVALAGIALIHSLVEYPLWYTYFLGVFAVVLALGDERPRALRIGRVALAAPVLLGAVVCGLLVRDYLVLQALSVPMRAQDSVEPFRERNQALVRLRSGSLLKPYADFALAATMLPTRTELAAKATLCRRTLSFQPSVPPVFTCALIYELAGDHQAAQTLWMLAARASPEHLPGYLDFMANALDENERRELQPFNTRSAQKRLP